MRIVIVTWRHWSAGRRYWSLLRNAPCEGHEIFGIAANHRGDVELTLTAFAEAGVLAYPESEFDAVIDKLNPDVVFGEHYHKQARLEYKAQHWAAKHGKVGIILTHTPYITSGVWAYDPDVNLHLIVPNDMQEERALQRGWPQERIHVIGTPDVDYVGEPIDAFEIRKQLGIEPDEIVIGLFPANVDRVDRGELERLMRHANREGWRVFIHVHPEVRKLQNSAGPEGWNWNYGTLWPTLQRMGATFIAGYGPGTIDSVKFIRCQSYELMAAADCLVANTPDPAWEAYVLGRRCHLLRTVLHAQWHWGWRVDPSANALMDMAFEEEYSHTNYGKIQAALERNDNRIEPDPAILEKWLYKLDGLCWRRMLKLAKDLTGG